MICAIRELLRGRGEASLSVHRQSILWHVTVTAAACRQVEEHCFQVAGFDSRSENHRRAGFDSGWGTSCCWEKPPGRASRTVCLGLTAGPGSHRRRP